MLGSSREEELGRRLEGRRNHWHRQSGIYVRRHTVSRCCLADLYRNYHKYYLSSENDTTRERLYRKTFFPLPSRRLANIERIFFARCNIRAYSRTERRIMLKLARPQLKSNPYPTYGICPNNKTLPGRSPTNAELYGLGRGRW